MISFHTLAVTLLVLLIVVALTSIAAILARVNGQRREKSRQRFLDDLQTQFDRLKSPGQRATALDLIAAGFRGRWAFLAAEEVSGLDPDLQLEVAQVLEERGIAAQFLNQSRSPLKWKRIEALRVLGQLAMRDSVPTLLRALDDKDPDVRNVAARTLGGMKLEETEEALVAILGRHEPSISARIAAICIEIGPRTGPLLVRTLQKGNPQARFWAARILGEMKEQRATGVLGNALGDSEADVRSAAAWALGRIGDSATPKLLEEALHDPVWHVRAHAAESLGRIGDPSMAAKLGEALTDPSWWVRRNALDGLVRLGDAARPVLIEALESDDRFARDCATEALTTLGVPLPSVPQTTAGA